MSYSITERIFCYSSIILIKNRCFIFLWVSIKKRHNPLSLHTESLIEIFEEVQMNNKPHQPISAHNICYLHISILFPAVAIWFIQNWGQSKRIIINEAHFELDFLNVFSLRKLTSSLSFSYNFRQYSGESQYYFWLDLAEEIRGEISRSPSSGTSSFSDLLNSSESC